ncbi:uncharacterized protein LOC114304112 [Camellia sinensis]|uniref:uncharacterized protein LOC114304112 n=1 Tax=Camellia sinensis TaxID=4442 RepID=UPI001036BAFE|nr:uncharacterized protein LOC114304112 [Camellia sinensis]
MAVFSISVQPTASGYLLSQSKYAKDIFLKAGLFSCKPCPSIVSVKPRNPSNASLPFHNPTIYNSIVGALQYLTIARPDISLAVNQACQYMHSPIVGHLVAVKRILIFVHGTFTHGLTFTHSTFDVHGYSDSNWQGTMSRSSIEAEYRALAHAAAELSLISMLLTEMGISLPTTPIL